MSPSRPRPLSRPPLRSRHSTVPAGKPARRAATPQPPKAAVPAAGARSRPPAGPRPRVEAGRPRRVDVGQIIDDSEASLLDVVDNLLTRGVVLDADIVLSLAGVDLVYLRLSALLCAADRLLPRKTP